MDFNNLVEIHEKEIPGSSIVFTELTRKWCQLPYENHKKGCPNFNKNDTCPSRCKYRKDILEKYDKFTLVYAVFNFQQYKEIRMKEHPDWSEKQAGCVLYWQSSIKKMLKGHIRHIKYDEMLGTGSGFWKYSSMEAAGIYVFKTLLNNGIRDFEIKPKTRIFMVVLLMERKSKTMW